MGRDPALKAARHLGSRGRKGTVGGGAARDLGRAQHVGEEGRHCRWWGSRILAAGEGRASLVAMGRDPALKAARHLDSRGRKGAVGGDSAAFGEEGRRWWGVVRGILAAGEGRRARHLGRRGHGGVDALTASLSTGEELLQIDGGRRGTGGAGAAGANRGSRGGGSRGVGEGEAGDERGRGDEDERGRKQGRTV
ncbi:hypothetical protein Zm00014a_012466 [Zea mays]|uniref:Uncharacterized protein n=1 Tax=Zea mays TaxID=4577 RepID=A0A3L6FYI7_MAIZE|nr:hypothetical protein Zm00014a_012466 [Zea mays]